jgi:hypothetical protein
MSLGLSPQRSSPAAVIDRSPSAPSVSSDSTAKPEQLIAFGEGAVGRVGTAILKKSFGPALKKMEEHGAMLLIRNGGKYLPTTITKLVISQVEAKLSDMTAVQLSNPKLVMALIGSIQLKGLGMTVGALATKSGVSLVSSVATAVTVEQFKRQAEQAENNKPLTDKIWKVLGDVADALNPLSMGGAGQNSTMDSQRTYNEAYQRNLKQLQEAQRQLDAQKPVGQDNTTRTAPPVTPPQVRQPTPAEIAAVQKQQDASRPNLPRPIAIPGYTDTRPSEPVSAPLVGVGIVGGRAEQYTAQQLADRMQKFAGTTGGVQPSSVFNWVKVSESGKFDTTPITQPVANKETAQAIAFNKTSLTVQLAVPVDYWDQTSKQHTQGYLQFKGLDPRAVLTKFNDYLVSLHGTQSFNVRGNFEEILKNSGLSVDGLKQRAQYFDNTELAKNLPVIGGKQATLGTGDMVKNLATVKNNNTLNLSQGQPNKLSVLIPTNPGSYDAKNRHFFAEGIGANNAAALLQYAADHGLLRPGTSPAQVIQANGLSSVLGTDASGQVKVLPKAEIPKTLTEKDIKEAWEKLGGSELGEQIVRHADREGLSSKDVLAHIQRNPGKNLNEILAGLRDGNLDFGGTPPNGGAGRNTTVAGAADGPEANNQPKKITWEELGESKVGKEIRDWAEDNQFDSADVLKYVNHHHKDKDLKQILKDLENSNGQITVPDELPVIKIAPEELAKNMAATEALKTLHIPAELNFKHVIYADFAQKGKAMGGHSLVKPETTRIKSGTESAPDANGVYKCEVQLFNPVAKQWTDKPLGDGGHTMFPKTWTEDRIKVEVINAWNSRKTHADGSWTGTTTSGVKIEGFSTGEGTFYPKYEPISQATKSVPKPKSVDSLGDGKYQVNYGDNKLSAAHPNVPTIFMQVKGQNIDIKYINRGDLPPGSGAQMLADSIENITKVSKPRSIQFNTINNEATIAALQNGTAPENTLLGKVLTKTGELLGGKSTGYQVTQSKGTFGGTYYSIKVHLKYD